MPNVMGKKFSYTKAGMKKAKAYAKKKNKKVTKKKKAQVNHDELCSCLPKTKKKFTSS